MMDICFRADSSGQIGAGHVMRCLTLAEGLREKGAKVSFISKPLPGHLCDFIEGRGFAVHRETERAGAILTASPVDWLVIDHYGLDAAWESEQRRGAKRIMVISDGADRVHDCDLLLDQNFSTDQARYNFLVPSNCRKLLGPRYALLGKRFAEMRDESPSKARTGEVRRLLVSFGGSDPTNETAKTLWALEALAFDGLDIDVVVGQSNSHRAEIEKMAKALKRVELHIQAGNIAELMAAADLAIGAGGTTTWERFCMGLPSLVLSTAQNQTAIAELLAENGLIFYLGCSADVTQASLERALKTMLENPWFLKSLSRASRDLVDGRGVDRIVRQMMPPQISLRLATLEDSKSLYKWRHAAVNREQSFNPEPFAMKQHEEWLSKTLKASDRILLIGESEDGPVGVLRYDIQSDGRALASIHLVPGRHGLGWGSVLLDAGTLWLKKERDDVREIKAEIKPENIASQRAFLGSGYVERKRVYINKINEGATK